MKDYLIEKYLGERVVLGKIGEVNVDKLYDEEIKKFLKKYPEYNKGVKWHGVVNGKDMNDIIKKSIIKSIDKARKKMENLNMSKSQIEKETRNFLYLNILTTAKNIK